MNYANIFGTFVFLFLIQNSNQLNMSNLRILYVATEINPFLQTSQVADFVRKLPQDMQERGMEIRILVPRFGLINERKNRLHEVVRLSGINIAVGDEEKPLVIKVASIPNAKLQVYFIDNEDYFHRKSVFHDSQDKFYEDNDERAIFFCKGVMETVKKLGWAPDIVHCNDWMTSLIPLYLKTTYKNDPLFQNTKSVFTVYNNRFSHKFKSSLLDKVKMLDIDDSMLRHCIADVNGEFIDKESGLPHVVLMAVNGMFKYYQVVKNNQELKYILKH